jgi:hypothetical protein
VVRNCKAWSLCRVMASRAAELRARAELAEQRLADLREMYVDMKEQRDRWETVAQRLSLPAPKLVETPEAPPKALLWRWLRSTG